jgi:hypothetical protein
VAILRRRGHFAVQTVRRLGQSACGVFVGITKATTAQIKEVAWLSSAIPQPLFDRCCRTEWHDFAAVDVLNPLHSTPLGAVVSCRKRQRRLDRLFGINTIT